MKTNNFTVLLCCIIAIISLGGCATTMAVADIVGTTAVYTGKTVINTLDAVTPDIVN